MFYQIEQIVKILLERGANIEALDKVLFFLKQGLFQKKNEILFWNYQIIIDYYFHYYYCLLFIL